MSIVATNPGPLLAVPLEYATQSAAESWPKLARIWAGIALFVGIVQSLLSILRLLQNLGGPLGIATPPLDSPELFNVGMNGGLLLGALMLVAGAALFLLTRRFRGLIIAATLLLAAMSVISAGTKGAMELSNYRGRVSSAPPHQFIWAAVRSLEGFLQASLYLMLVWPFMKLRNNRGDKSNP